MKETILETCGNLVAVFKAPPEDVELSVKQEGTYRDVISLQAIFVTLTIALLAYIQKDPVFRLHVDALFAVMAMLPLLGLFHIVRGRVKTPAGDVYVCTRPIRSLARQAFMLDLFIVLSLSLLYWLGDLPGQ